MTDLSLLNSFHQVKNVSHLIFSKEVWSPLREPAWTEELVGHPDKSFVEFILQGIQEGFRIGHDRRHYLVPATSNLSIDNPQAVTEYLDREVTLGRMHVSQWKTGLQTSPLGLVPKKNKPGKWRLIVDLSSPKEGSVNGGINTELLSLSYASVDHLAANSCCR